MTVPSGRLAGRPTAGAVPVPVKVTFWVFGMTLSVKTSEAISELFVDGLNVSETTQLDGAVSGFAGKHVFPAMEKSVAFVPVTDGALVKVTVPAPVTLSVTVMMELVVPWG